MNKYKRIITSGIIGLALYASAASNEMVLIIEGHFFNEIPVASSEITGMSRISTPSGGKAMLITLANPLPEAALKYSIPAEEIDDATDLLKRAENAKILSVTMATATEEKIAVGGKFPQFSATDINGKRWSNSDVEGKAMVLNLWFTGCGPCRAEMHELSQWKNEMPDVMFFSATYEDANTARPVIEKQGFNWIPIVNDTQFKEWIDSTGYPLTIVVDKKGIITHIEHGTSPIQREEMRKKIEEVR
jgi:thiol-disulfide isomerase/thioredoxin